MMKMPDRSRQPSLDLNRQPVEVKDVDSVFENIAGGTAQDDSDFD
jgi:hypothetical protein